MTNIVQAKTKQAAKSFKQEWADGSVAAYIDEIEAAVPKLIRTGSLSDCQRFNLTLAMSAAVQSLEAAEIDVLSEQAVDKVRKVLADSDFQQAVVVALKLQQQAFIGQGLYLAGAEEAPHQDI